MVLAINDFKPVATVQASFNQHFPYLKVEFYAPVRQNKKDGWQPHHVAENKNIGQIRKLHMNGELRIMTWYTLDKVQADFRELFGLQVAFYLLFKNNWIQINKAGNLTLSELKQPPHLLSLGA